MAQKIIIAILAIIFSIFSVNYLSPNFPHPDRDQNIHIIKITETPPVEKMREKIGVDYIDHSPSSYPYGHSSGPVILSTRPSVQSEKRDQNWSERTEQDVKGVLKNIPHIDKSAPLSMLCGATVCEANGQISLAASPSERELAFSYLANLGFAEDLGSINALTDDVDINRNTGAFRIFFSRVRR